MDAKFLDVSWDEISEFNFKLIDQLIRKQVFPQEFETASAKRRRLNRDRNVSEQCQPGHSVIPTVVGIDKFEDQVVLLRTKLRLNLIKNAENLSLKSTIDQVLTILAQSLGKSEELVYRIACTFTIDDSRSQLQIFSVGKKTLIIQIDISNLELLGDLRLFRSVFSNKKLTNSTSPLKIPSPCLCFSVAASLSIYLDFGVVLPSSAVPSAYAAEMASVPVFDQLIHKAFPALSMNARKYNHEPDEKSMGSDERQAVTPVQFYRAICQHQLPKASPMIQHPDLITPLLDYQAQTVEWCLQREGKFISSTSGELENMPISDLPFPPLGWTKTEVTGKYFWVAPQYGLVCTSDTQLRDESYSSFMSGAKGLIAEEMGLGKSIEAIDLILLNRRPDEDIGRSTIDSYSGDEIVKSKATLIISPTSIHKQWMEEFKKHSRTLSVYDYRGAWSLKNRVGAAEIADYDVVLTTYNILTREIHYAQQPPARSLRHEPKYERFRSPLVQLEFWRVMLDEVQLVETGVSNAALVARLVPRFHAWGISGTPIRNELSDLSGLLQFLRYVPYTQGHQAKVWERLYKDREAFCQFFTQISLRHTKDMVKDSIALPPQRRIVLTIPFTTVEENNYRHLFQEFLDDCGFTPTGAPAHDEWDPAEVLPKMSRWLGRLRQTCCHAQIGAGNRRALGGGPLRTVNDVLEAMLENAQSTVLTDERTYWTSLIQRGQLYEQNKDADRALELWMAALEGVQKVLLSCRRLVEEDLKAQQEFLVTVKRRRELEKQSTAIRDQSLLEGEDAEDALSDDEEAQQRKEERSMMDQIERETEDNLKNRVSASRHRVRTFLELQHRCLFFIASIHFQKENKELEDKYYGLAQAARQELLQESQGKAQVLMNRLMNRAKLQKFVEIPEIKDVDEIQGTLETRSTISRIRELSGFLNEQANVLDEWREKVISLMSQNLVDKDSEPDGEEYTESLDAQEEGFSYQEAIRQVLADRNEALNGVRNNLVEYDIEREDLLDKRTELATKLLQQRRAVKPPPHLGSLKLAHEELRRTTTQLMYNAEDANGDRLQRRYEVEYAIADTELNNLRELMDSQKHVLEKLDKELLFFRLVYNARIEYYRQLQQISDGVAEFVPKDVEKFSKSAVQQESRILNRVRKGYARFRYLEHLKRTVLGNAGSVPESERMCVICQCPFEIGSLTVCGHQYCRDCIVEWWKFHRSCPICKRSLKESDLYSISYKATEIQVQEEQSSSSTIAGSGKGAIYSGLSSEALNKIKAIDLIGSFGSKIDMILQHMIWLRENEPNVQVVLFSQWSEFLKLVAMALTRHSIRYATLDQNMENFKSNPDIMCFLLHARSQSSGLTLINATHVILCEPLFNTALELQAISRVHRIGQTRPTTVWMYAIGGTVEESVLSLVTKRRIALMNPESETANVDFTEAKLDVSNTIALSRASGRMMNRRGDGEVVPQDELWDLFFGQSAAVESHSNMKRLENELKDQVVGGSEGLSLEYQRFVAAESAERRMVSENK
ncbi:SNF2 family N-terminal domain-containing protein [Lipomyces oligophaga]|uniref:SNF2 family N-terminal domain-containing protein n=1 Tax=Lipomyces oligophaga TaxID=45792 RepID=UPI0034CF0285